MRAARFASGITAAIALAVSSCASMKFWDRGETPADELTADAPAAPTPAPAPARTEAVAKPEEKPVSQPTLVDDNLRLPDMLSLPSARELRRTAPEPDSSGTAGVTARPPVESPSRTSPNDD